MMLSDRVRVAEDSGPWQSMTLSKPLSMRLIDHALARSIGMAIAAVNPLAALATSTTAELGSSDAAGTEFVCPRAGSDHAEHIHDLHDCCLRVILAQLSPEDLARGQAVCQKWRDMASLPDVLAASFVTTWRLSAAHAVGPRAWLHLQSIKSPKAFVVKHVVQPGDSVQAIAVKHGVDTMALKQLNSIITDRSVACRSWVFVPSISSPEQLAGCTVTYEFDTILKRGFAVVSRVHDVISPAGDVKATEQQLQQLQKKMSLLLARSMRVDESSARYYLEDCGGDLKQAMKLAAEDAAWESSAQGSRQHRRRVL